jgi:hypothetical protein
MPTDVSVAAAETATAAAERGLFRSFYTLILAVYRSRDNMIF